MQQMSSTANTSNFNKLLYIIRNLYYFVNHKYIFFQEEDGIRVAQESRGLGDVYKRLQIYNEPENAFVADFIGESNIVPGLMIHDELVEIFGAKFACVDKGFGNNKPVDVVIRPEDIDLLKPEEGTLQGVVTHLIFKGVHYEMEVTTPDGFEWLVHSTDMFPVGQQVGLHVDPFDIQIMNKPASEDEEALGVNE